MASRDSPAFQQTAADRARTWRILIAVVISAFAHTLFMSGAATGPSGRRAEQAAHTPLRAMLVPSQSNAYEREAEDAATINSRATPATKQASPRKNEASGASSARRVDAPGAQVSQKTAENNAPLQPAATASATATGSDRALHSRDTTYYSIRQLDIYPVPVAPLELKTLTKTLVGDVRARALVELHISETGVVESATVLETHPPGSLEGELTAVFLAARFTPAVRDGRAVRSRVLVRVE